MKLFYSPIHDFAHKTLIVAWEANILSQITLVPVYPFRDGFDITAINPLNKVPTLVTEDQASIYGSQAIAEYLDSLAPGGQKLYPQSGAIRWDALRRLALADSLFEMVTQLVTDHNYGDGERSLFVDWLWPKVLNTVAQMNLDAKVHRSFDIGDAAQIHALTYLDLCIPEHGPQQIDPSYNWRSGNPLLKTWFDVIIERESVQYHYKRAYEGLDTAANCQAHVNEVLVARDAR